MGCLWLEYLFRGKGGERGMMRVLMRSKQGCLLINGMVIYQDDISKIFSC